MIEFEIHRHTLLVTIPAIQSLAKRLLNDMDDTQINQTTIDYSLASYQIIEQINALPFEQEKKANLHQSRIPFPLIG